jgi:hypothetical protein
LQYTSPQRALLKTSRPPDASQRHFLLLGHPSGADRVSSHRAPRWPLLQCAVAPRTEAEAVSTRGVRTRWLAARPSARSMELPAQLDFSAFERPPALGTETAPRAIDVVVEHRHRGLKRSRLAPPTHERRTRERGGNAARPALLEYSCLEIQSIAGFEDLRRPAAGRPFSHERTCATTVAISSSRSARIRTSVKCRVCAFITPDATPNVGTDNRYLRACRDARNPHLDQPLLFAHSIGWPAASYS